MTQKIEIDTVKMFRGDLNEYSRWNVENAARAILARPEEREIALMVYDIHRRILENSGYNSENLKEADDKLVRLVKDGTKVRLN